MPARKTKKIVQKEEPVDYPVPSEPKKSNSILVPTLVIAVIILAFLAGSLWQKVKLLEGGGTVSEQSANNLSIENLKKYAKDLKLDTKKFNACLDNDEKKNLVASELSEGEGLGVQGTPGFFMNGRLIPGALPFDIFKQIIDYELSTGFDSSKEYPQEIQDLITQGYISPDKLDVAVGSSPSIGPENAEITLIEYSDFECPYCIRAYPTVKQILSEYQGKIRFAYKHYPLSTIHPNAQKAAEASACAADQGKFWEYHDKLFDTSTS